MVDLLKWLWGEFGRALEKAAGNGKTTATARLFAIACFPTVLFGGWYTVTTVREAAARLDAIDRRSLKFEIFVDNVMPDRRITYDKRLAEIETGQRADRTDIRAIDGRVRDLEAERNVLRGRASGLPEIWRQAPPAPPASDHR